MRIFIYGRGVNGESIASVIETLQKGEVSFIDDSSSDLNLEQQAKHITPNDLVLIASTKHYDTLAKKLKDKGIANYKDGILWCGEILREELEAYKNSQKHKRFIGIVLSNPFIQGSFKGVASKLEEHFGAGSVVYLVYTKELYLQYKKDAFCLLSPHALLEQIDNIDLLLLANSEPTHKSVLSLDLTHGFQGPLIYPFMDNQDKNFLKYAFSTVSYVACGSKRVHRAYRECFLELGDLEHTQILDLGYVKLDSDYKAYTDTLLELEGVELAYKNCVVLAFTFLNDIEILSELINTLSPHRPVVFLPHPVFAKELIPQVEKRFLGVKNLLFGKDFKSRYEMFASASCIITDCSSMGYTFPLITQKPAIVFTQDLQDFKRRKLKDGEHYLDSKLHYLAVGYKEVLEQLELLEEQKQEYAKGILEYREIECFNFGHSREALVKWIVEKLK